MLDHDMLMGIRKPARYTGGEWNAAKKDFDKASVRFALCFPDMYEVGMSNLGIRIIYSVLNGIEDVSCERVFSPDIDMEKVLRAQGRPVFSIESGRNIRDFDIVGFSVAYELCYTNILNMLDLASIPFDAADRGAEFPLVIGGGPAVLNPEPIARFFDLFIIGEAEEAIVQIIDIYRRLKRNFREGVLSKNDLLFEFAKIEGVYVPSFYDAVYDEKGNLSSFSPNRQGVPDRVRKRIVPDLNFSCRPDPWVVPYIQVVHDRITVEVSRGCPNRCRFCQAKSGYYPLRYRSQDKVLETAKKYYSQTGYEEISLSGLSVSDYPDLPGLLSKLVGFFKDKGVGVSLPSVKPKDFLGCASGLIASIKKTGLTFAPEAATARLRSVIGKDFDEDEFFKMLDGVYGAGYQHVKLYFMVGLPGETEQDVEGIACFSAKVSAARKARAGSGAQVNVSVNTVIPKPHTPFQWSRMLSIEEMKEKQSFLLSKFHNKKIKVSFHGKELNFLEGVFSRGDRRLSSVIRTAHAKGCRFDGWSEHFRPEFWFESFSESGIEPVSYLRQRDTAERLPWDFIDIGVPKAFLAEEYEKMSA